MVSFTETAVKKRQPTGFGRLFAIPKPAVGFASNLPYKVTGYFIFHKITCFVILFS